MANNSQGFSAVVGSGTIAPSTFVSMMTVTPAISSNVGAGYYVQQSVLSGLPIGISQEGTRYAPTDENNLGGIAAYAGGYTGVAGYTGDPIKVYGIGDTCQLSIGATVTPNQLLIPNASGQGVPLPAGATGVYAGAISQEGGTSGDTIRVQVLIR